MPPKLLTPKTSLDPCVTLIGMAGAGKSTVGNLLAKALSWAHLDTDDHLQAMFGRPLQEIMDSLGRETFIKAEEEAVAALKLSRVVISTGGSVIYGPKAIGQLKSLGPLIFLDLDLDTVARRVADAQGRGLAIAKGQTLADLYNERRPLYQAAADFTVDTALSTPDACTRQIRDWLQAEHSIS